MSSRMAAVRKQSQQTWINLHSRLRSTPFTYSGMFPTPVGEYIKDNAVAISSCEGYVFNSLLATTSFLLCQNSTVTYNGFHSKPKLFILFVGPPSTGKSQAINTACLDPMASIAEDNNTESRIVGKSTSAGLLQKLSDDNGGGAMLVSSEMFDILNKMVKNDGENGNGDIAMLSQMFSNERVTVSYATQRSKDIAGDTPFAILGAIQPAPTALLMTALDSGNGFIERLILTFPDCLRPSPAQTRAAKLSLQGKPSLTDIMKIVSAVGSSGLDQQETEYSFDEEAEKELDRINEAYIEAINTAIIHGSPPPQTKRLDIIIRVAPALHVLSTIMKQMLLGEQNCKPSRIINKETLTQAMEYVDFCEGQKETFLCELRNLTDLAATPPITQPQTHDVNRAVIRTPGPVINFRTFKSACSKTLRSVSRKEYDAATAKLQRAGLGETSTHRMANGGKEVCVFIKKNPTTVDWDQEYIITQGDYTKAYQKKIPTCFTSAMKDSLVSMGYVDRNVFTS